MAASSQATFSPPSISYGASSTTGPLQGGTISSRVVTKLAIEGRCQAEDQGATLRLFMKIVLPVDGLVGGSSIPLFPEENVRIVTSRVHPLDSTGTPYAFSSTAVPLLHKTARALNLPARSNKSYYTFLGIPPPSPALASPGESSTSRRAAAAGPLPLSVTGEINVSNFHICFILPRILPTRGAILVDSETEQAPRNRRSSFVERDGKSVLFMAGVEIFVPFVSRPPKAPYLLSLPLPRCLSNHIKLRVMPPSKLPSGQDPPPWDLSCEPMVTYKASHGSRSTSYEQLADDEVSLEGSMESSTPFISSNGVQGTFPSTDRIRIRWAAPMNRNQGLGVLSDGRRRVGVDEGVGSLHCTILGKDDRGRAKLRLEYEGTCKGLWFPGVATQLGLDVILDGKGRSVEWASEDEQWEVSGATGFGGYDGATMPPSPDTPDIIEEPSSRIPRPTLNQNSRISSYATSSLLHTALPSTSMLPDYSFETTPSPTVSMINSTGTPYGHSAVSSGIMMPRDPTTAITIFLNIGDLPSPPQNEFNFRINGTVLLGPPREGDYFDGEEDALELPVFRILPAEKSRIDFIVSSEMQQGVDVILPQEKRRPGMVNGLRTPPPRRKTLRRKMNIHADEGVSVVFSPASPVASPAVSPESRFQATPRTPTRAMLMRTPRTPRTPRPLPGMNNTGVIASPKVGGAYPIPWVRASVTLLPASKQQSHAIQFTVPSVAVTDGVLSFGVCLPSFLADSEDTAIEIVSATADGMNCEVEVFPRNAQLDEEKLDQDSYDQALRLMDFTTQSGELKRDEMGEMAVRDIDSWIRIILPDENTLGNLEVHYLIARDPKQRLKRKANPSSEQLSILLPAFHVGVGTYSVDFHTPRGYKEPIVLSNFHQQEDGRLSHYRLPGYFYPRVKVQIESQATPGSNLPMKSVKITGWLLRRMLDAIPALASLAMLWIMITLREDVRDLRFLSNFPLMSRAPLNDYQPPTAQQQYAPPAPAGAVTAVTSATFPYAEATATAGNELEIAKMYSLSVPLALMRWEWGRLADTLLMTMEKLIHVLQAVWHFPAPPP